MNNSIYSIYIEFTRPKGFKIGSLLIRAIENTLYSHVRLRFMTGRDVEIIYEAAGSMVRFLGPRAQKEHEVTVVRTYLLVLTKEQYREMIHCCISLAGIKYGTLQLIGMGIARCLNRRFNILGDKLNSLVCSELVGYILKDILKIPIKIRPELDGPKELDRQLFMCQNKKNLMLIKE